MSYDFSLILFPECFPSDCKQIIPSWYYVFGLIWIMFLGRVWIDRNKMCWKFMNIKPSTLLAIFWLQFRLKEQKCWATLFVVVFCFLFSLYWQGKALPNRSAKSIYLFQTWLFLAILYYYRLMFYQVSVLVFCHLLYLCWNMSTIFLVSNFKIFCTLPMFCIFIVAGCNMSVSNM